LPASYGSDERSKVETFGLSKFLEKSLILLKKENSVEESLFFLSKNSTNQEKCGKLE